MADTKLFLLYLGMPPNVFSNRGAKKAKTGTVPPVHSLAKVGIDVTNMSAAEKVILSFCSKTLKPP